MEGDRESMEGKNNLEKRIEQLERHEDIKEGKISTLYVRMQYLDALSPASEIFEKCEEICGSEIFGEVLKALFPGVSAKNGILIYELYRYQDALKCVQLLKERWGIEVDISDILVDCIDEDGNVSQGPYIEVDPKEARRIGKELARKQDEE